MKIRKLLTPDDSANLSQARRDRARIRRRGSERATIAAIVLRFASHAELIALAFAALFAFVRALGSLSRLGYGNSVEGPNASRFLCVSELI